MILSKCHRERVIVHESDNGDYFVCSDCNKPTEPITLVALDHILAEAYDG